MYIDDIKKTLAPYLSEFNQAYTNILKSEINLLDEITSHIKLSSGKQIRPIFTYLSAMLCGEISAQTTRTALSIELLHTSTLIHDDVVDNSFFRRGKETINKKWNNKLAVLTGDYLLSLVLKILSKNNDLNILTLLSNVAIDLSEGEVLQQEKSIQWDYSEANYYEIIRKKTAALLSACFEGGASSVNADTQKAILLREIGESVGIAFQIKDDILDYTIHAETGKMYGNDIRERKFTLPLIAYMHTVSAEEQLEILNLFKKEDIGDNNIISIIERVNSSNAMIYAKNAMNKYINKALMNLDSFPSSEAKSALRETILFTIERTV